MYAQNIISPIININKLSIKTIYLLSRRCLITIDNARMEGTHIPTNIPSSCCPENQRLTEYKKERKARITG
tara:strand:- start:295 stop:507 length:213 start_codon:yes stop_codon:yes gene_type:complete